MEAEKEAEKNLRLFLRVFDYAACTVSGLLAAYLTSLVVSPGWPMPLGMIAGMLLGTAAFAAVFIVTGKIAGGFEILMPCLTVGMAVGMIAGMWVTLGDLSGSTLLWFGVGAGLYTAALFHMHDKSLHGEVEIEGA